MIKLPIRQLVELIMRCGNIDSRYVSKDRMVEGAKAHRILQKNNHELYIELLEDDDFGLICIVKFNYEIDLAAL